MPRKKLSEFRAKTIIHQALGLKYTGCAIDTDLPVNAQLKTLEHAEHYVVKVDQGVKGRFKKGLVLLDVTRKALPEACKKLRAKGYRWLIIEPMLPHAENEERYLALAQDRRGLSITYSRSGGINIEAHPEALKSETIADSTDWEVLGASTGLTPQQLRQLVEAFEQNYMVFLEINPYLVTPEGLQLLDLAIEVDDTGGYYVNTWSEADFRRSFTRALTKEEQMILEMDENSPASLKLDVINPGGAIFLLLSGGGASIVVADEVYNQGHGQQLANYGEYSGNPTTEETYLYTKAVLQLLLDSKARKKVLFIGGAVANFTDIANTFNGIIQALQSYKERLRKQHVKIFVRRGGPRQEIGLAKIETALQEYGLLGAVHGPDVPLTEAVIEMLESINQEVA